MRHTQLVYKGVVCPYEIYEDGRVYNYKRKKFIQTRVSDRYVRCNIVVNGERKSVLLHRLLMENFCPVEDMDKLQVNHIDGNRLNNDLSNLEWCTQKENVHHAWRTGLAKAKFGEGIGNHKHSEETIRHICDLLMDTSLTVMDISNMTGISDRVIGELLRKESWRHVTEQYDFPCRHQKYTDEDIIYVCQLINDGYTNKEIESITGIKAKTVGALRRGEFRKNITHKYLNLDKGSTTNSKDTNG